MILPQNPKIWTVISLYQPQTNFHQTCHPTNFPFQKPQKKNILLRYQCSQRSQGHHTWHKDFGRCIRKALCWCRTGRGCGAFHQLDDLTHGAAAAHAGGADAAGLGAHVTAATDDRLVQVLRHGTALTSQEGPYE